MTKHLVDPNVGAVLARYVRDAAQVTIQPLANAGGWSGSMLVKVTDQSLRDFCLRRWPAEYPVDRLRWIHAVLAVVGREMKIVACPQPTLSGETLIAQGACLWDLSPWMPGVADFHLHPSRARLRAAMRALAQFHELTARIERGHGTALAIADRQERWNWLQDAGLKAIEQSLQIPPEPERPRWPYGQEGVEALGLQPNLRPIAEHAFLYRDIYERATRLFEIGRRALESSRPLKLLAEVNSLPLQPAIRDIHHDHVLFMRDEVTGMIDFGAMRMDTPLADVARLMGSLVRDNEECQFALDAYAELRPLSDADRRLVDLLDGTTLILAALNWLTWLYVERRDMGPVEPIATRLDQILERLEWRIRQEGMSHG